MPLPRVVILGGGFAGLAAARGLRRAGVEVTLIDRRNHHLFQPLLYQVATAALNPSDIAQPIRRVLRAQENCRVLLGEATAIDPAASEVVLTDARVPYDFLVLATGATHSWFGRDDWAPHALGLKTLEDALLIRRRMLLAYEAAEREPDPQRRAAWMTFVVVGAGPTGVEMAGAFAEIARQVLRRDFRRIDPASARVLLVEAGDRVLSSYTPPLSRKAKARLERMGVEVLLGRKVVGVDAAGVTLAPEERIAARTLVWAAGVAASPLARSLGAPLDRAGRVRVEPDLTAPGAPRVYVCGDLMSIAAPDGKPVPGVAQGAIQAGAHAARNIRRELRGEPRLPFRYADKGNLATIGRAAAVAEIGWLRSEGLFAWLIWVVIHILSLIDFRSRLVVMLEWAWAYLRFERGARLITGEVGPLLEERGAAGALPATGPVAAATPTAPPPHRPPGGSG